MDRIMMVLLGCCLSVGALLLGLALRHRVLLALALRNVPRRRAQTILIVSGLMLSTAIIASSFTTGDTMAYSTRSVIAASLGRVDEVIVARGGYDEDHLGPNGLPGVTNGYFTAADFARLGPQIQTIPGVAGVTPAISEAVSLVDATSKQSKTKVTLIALPADYSAAFGLMSDMNGRAAPLGALAPDEVYLNREGATALSARSGDQIQLFIGGQMVTRRLKTVVRNGGPGGSEPAVIAPLAAIQRVLGETGRINQIYVANQGDVLSSDRWSVPVTTAIRALQVDDASAAGIATLLRDPALPAAITATPNIRPATRAKLAQLAAWARAGTPGSAPGPQFKSLLSDPTVIVGLAQVALHLTNPALREQLVQHVSAASTVSVSDVKHEGLLAANLVGAAITSIFVGLGLFSIASGTLLIFLIFVMLAAERRTEMGIARAIGTQRGHLVEMFLFEGGAYDLAAGLFGVILGLLVGLGTVFAISALLSSVDLQLTFHVEPRSVVVALCFGLLLTFATIALSAWRVSRLNIVAAIRNLPDIAQRPLRRQRLLHGDRANAENAAGWSVRVRLAHLDLRPPILAILAVAVARGVRGNAALLPVQALATSLAIVSLSLTARGVLATLHVGEALRDRLCYSAAGLALLAYWASPFNLLHGMRPVDLQAGVELYFLAGLAMVAGAVWAVVYNADALIVPLAALLGRLFPISAVLRTAAAYALRQRFRTGMALAMFALVIFTMVVAAVLSSASNGAYSNFGAAEGGFDIRGDTRSGQPITGIHQALAAAAGVKPSAFAAVGTYTTFSGQAIETGAAVASWQPVAVNAAGGGFLAGVRFSLAARAAGYGNDTAVWRALASTPGLAVIDASALAPTPGRSAGSGLTLAGVRMGDTSMHASTIWVRADAGGRPVKLQVIGVLDPRAAFGTGLTASMATFGGAVALPAPTTFYFKVAPGHDVHQVAQGLGLSFFRQGMQAQVLNDELQRTDGIRLLLNQLVESYLGLGLVVGIAALGVISTRAVVERRQHIGMLRALGFQRSMVQATFLLESAFVAVGGAVTGILLGLTLARSLTRYIGRDHPEIVFQVPWLQVVLIASIACAAGLLATWLPAQRAAQVRPAEALRYE